MKLKTHWSGDTVDVFFEDGGNRIKLGEMLTEADRFEFLEELMNLAYELMDEDKHTVQQAVLEVLIDTL